VKTSTSNTQRQLQQQDNGDSYGHKDNGGSYSRKHEQGQANTNEGER
jgi:hypothetical protein